MQAVQLNVDKIRIHRSCNNIEIYIKPDAIQLPSSTDIPMDPVFPLEIFNLIVTQVALAYNSWQDLHSCSRVCKDFAALSQPHLFKYLSIRWYAEEYTKPKLRRLAQSLQTNPALREYIQKVSCVHKGGGVVEKYNKDLDGCLLALLNLPNVHHLLIYSDHGAIDYNECRTDIFGYRSLVERYLNSGTLTSLVLDGISNLAIEPILACATLKTLELHNITLISLQSPHEPIPQQVPAFRRLKVYRVLDFPFSILKQLQTTLESLELDRLGDHGKPTIMPPSRGELIHFDHLTSLTSWSGVDWESLLGREGRASRKAFPSLRRLVADLYTDRDESAVNTIFDHLQVLERLELRASSLHLAPNLSSLANVITDMNRTLKSLEFRVAHNNFSQELINTLTTSFMSQPLHALESLESYLAFCIFDPSEIFSPASHDASYQHCWRKLASCLKDKNRFPHLHRVNLGITLHLDIEKFQEYEDNALEAFLKEPLYDEDFFDSTTIEVEFKYSATRVELQYLLS
ncbi:hypothetical protein BJ165DRAFT_1591793 [Panaeolus papilionaceus]|nr:hypothetical protein BJ165DRAFT_1591793 [Panaeolus papilionaceus]